MKFIYYEKLINKNTNKNEVHLIDAALHFLVLQFKNNEELRKIWHQYRIQSDIIDKQKLDGWPDHCKFPYLEEKVKEFNSNIKNWKK